MPKNTIPVGFWLPLALLATVFTLMVFLSPLFYA